ncbi:MAG: ATP-binding protein [Candidatus Shapirobacteria bacterium]|jgi:hypothetical protein
MINFFKKPEKKTEVAPIAPTATEKQQPGQRQFVDGLVSTKDIIAPGSLEVDFEHIRIDGKYYRTLFITGYPRFVGINWLSPLINFDASLNVSMFIYPTDGKEILDDLRRKIAEMEAEINTDIQRGRVVDPSTQAKLEDALNLQADLVKGEERFFQFGLYVTISATSKEEINRINKNLEAALGALMIISKKATLQMEEGFMSTLPLCSDKLNITRNMDTTSLATTFPFVSSDLSDDKGIMYGINEHNGSLVIFDRFSMQNYNSVVFASAGAGKSYLIKLEAIRSLMLGTEIIVIDPENEYRDLCEAVGGQYIAFGYGEESKINPFDLSLVVEEGENALNSKILALHKLFKIMIGAMDPIEESILDRAAMDAYKMKGITPDIETQTREPPLVEDLYKSLIGMEDKQAQNLAARFEKYIKGSFAGIFNQKTTVNLTNKFVVFGIRNLEDALRPVAMHIILDYIWTIVKKTLKRRILIVDEAWYLMQYEDSAAFLRGIVKRGRKYYIGVTTITQDVDDFLATPYGKEIVTNSAIQILLKQHSAAIDQVGDVFYLSEGEKQLLLTADKGEGIFFAGKNHVAIRVIASEDEHRLITSNPEEILKMKNQGKSFGQSPIPEPTVEPPVALIPTTEAKKPVEEIKKPEMESKPQQETAALDKTKLAPQIVAIPKEKTPAEGKPAMGTIYQTVVETNKPDEQEEILKKRLAEMAEQEKNEISEHRKKIAEEERQKAEAEAKRMAETSSSLPKYQDLFKSYTPAKTAGQTSPPPIKTGPLIKSETVGNKPLVLEPKRPIFLNQEEPKIPQPPQLSKKTKPVFEEPKEEVKAATDDGKTKMDYDKLFSN